MEHNNVHTLQSYRELFPEVYCFRLNLNISKLVCCLKTNQFLVPDQSDFITVFLLTKLEWEYLGTLRVFTYDNHNNHIESLQNKLYFQSP